MKNLSTLKRCRVTLVYVLPLLLAGCAGSALKNSFQDISETHAGLTDQQMLLNLARRANYQAAHFLQMSSVNASYSFAASIGTTTTHSRTVAAIAADVITKAFSFVGTLGLTATESPTFSFAPLSGSSFAKTAYTPVDSKIFFEQFRQGVPVNQLLRILVTSVILEYPTGKRLVLHNIPDEEQPQNFRNFLRLAGLARQMQLQHALSVSTVKDKNVLVIPPKSEQKLDQLYSKREYSFWEDSQLQLGLEDGTPKVSFVMRPFSGVLGAMGEAQAHFDQWLASGMKLEDIPVSEQRPILTMLWDEDTALTPSAAEVEFAGKTYKIADLDSGKMVTWNRDTFRILNDLFTIVSLDPKDLPVQQLIKVF
ncbi:MAG: hypothetical protein K0U68_06910 [Gammaproteobacteria bacterium]|nr:hypothetical protein [Gammaproteobacteria bacterium]